MAYKVENAFISLIKRDTLLWGKEDPLSMLIHKSYSINKTLLLVTTNLRKLYLFMVG